MFETCRSRQEIKILIYEMCISLFILYNHTTMHIAKKHKIRINLLNKMHDSSNKIFVSFKRFIIDQLYFINGYFIM